MTEGPDGKNWVSTNGLSWLRVREEVRPFYGGMGEFIGITTESTTERSPSPNPYLRRSSDGFGWTAAEPEDEAPWTLGTYRYFGLGVDEILSLSLSLPDAWNGGGPSGAILRLDDTYVAYYFTDGYWQNPTLEQDTSFVGAAVSSDGRSWRQVEVPDFLSDWFQDEEERCGIEVSATRLGHGRLPSTATKCWR